MLQDSIYTLKMAQSKFQESKKSIEKAQKYDLGQLLLVPLTGSVRYYAWILSDGRF